MKRLLKIQKSEYELAVENGIKEQWEGKWIGCNPQQLYTACVEGAKAGYNRTKNDYREYIPMVQKSINVNGLACAMFLHFHFHKGGKECEPHARLKLLDNVELVDIPLEQWRILYGYECDLLEKVASNTYPNKKRGRL